MRDHDEVTGISRGLLSTGAAAALLVAAAWPVQAQEDARFLPWVGCWESTDQYEEGMLCVRPVTDGVELLTVVDGAVTNTETLTGDGDRHPLEREGCSGWQAARFSADERRLFLEAEHTCEGEFTRRATGLMAMTSPTTWIDVQVVDAGGRDMAWVRHYRQASQTRVEEAGFAGITAGRGMALRTARYEAASSADVDDVLEAADNVQSEAVKAWVAELRDPFDLDGDRLVQLADAGLDPEVIDVMVAVSYPEHFQLDAAGVPGETADEYVAYAGPRPYGYGYRDRFWYDPFYHPYSYGYGGYGGYGWGIGGYGWGYRPTVVVVTPAGDDAGRGGGRMVKGRGYTRPSSSGSARGSGSTRRTGSSAAAGSSSVGSSRSTGSSSSGSTGRKAKRRGGGGGGGFDLLF